MLKCPLHFLYIPALILPRDCTPHTSEKFPLLLRAFWPLLCLLCFNIHTILIVNASWRPHFSSMATWEMQIHPHLFLFLSISLKESYSVFCLSFWQERWSQTCSAVNTFFLPPFYKKMWGRRGTESHLSNLSGLRADWGLWGFVLLSAQHCLVGPCGGIKVGRRRRSPQENSLRGALETQYQAESYFHANHQDWHQSLIHKVSRAGLEEGQGSESRWLNGRSFCQCGRRGFNPWVGKILWRRKWQPTPAFLPGKLHGQRGAWRVTVHGSPKIGHDWVTEHTRLVYSAQKTYFPVWPENITWVEGAVQRKKEGENERKEAFPNLPREKGKEDKRPTSPTWLSVPCKALRTG